MRYDLNSESTDLREKGIPRRSGTLRRHRIDLRGQVCRPDRERSDRTGRESDGQLWRRRQRHLLSQSIHRFRHVDTCVAARDQRGLAGKVKVCRVRLGRQHHQLDWSRATLTPPCCRTRCGWAIRRSRRCANTCSVKKSPSELKLRKCSLGPTTSTTQPSVSCCIPKRSTRRHPAEHRRPTRGSNLYTRLRTTGTLMDQPLLTMTGVTKRFGATLALRRRLARSQSGGEFMR